MKNKIISTLILIALFSLGSWFFYKYLFDNGFGIFNLLVNGTPSELISTRSGELIAGDKVFGRFQTPYPNLGIVSVRFNNHYRDSNDTLMFRIKETGSQKWYYEAKYNTDQFLPGKLFPFGFPIIAKSNGKSFQFELESLRGATGSGIFLDSGRPVFTAASFYNRQEILGNHNNTIVFFIQKVINVIRDKENLIISIIYYSPLLFYLIYLLLNGTSFQILSLVTFFSILAEVFYFQSTNNFLYLAILFIWGLTVFRYKFESSISVFIALILFVLNVISLVFNQNYFAEKFAIWSYLLLCFTFIQQIVELNLKNTERYSLERAAKNLMKVKFDKNKISYRFFKTFFPPIVFLFGVYEVWKIYDRINHSLKLFKSFFPYDHHIPGYSEYIWILIGIGAFSVLLVYFQKSVIKTYPAISVVLAIFFELLVSFASSRMTTFQHLPKIFNVSPSVTSEAWVDITVHGKNFQDLPFVGKVYLGGVEQGEYLLHWSDEKIVFRTNPTFTASGIICVQTLSKGVSNCVPFEYNFGKEKQVK